jgi:hypothetical protein
MKNIVPKKVQDEEIDNYKNKVIQNQEVKAKIITHKKN